MNITKFDSKCKCGPEFVCVRILENFDDLKAGSIYLPASVGANSRLAHCVIEDIGEKAAEEYGIKTGDYVMIDRLSTFAHTAPIALLKYNNVIFKTNKDRSICTPLRNMLFVKPDTKDGIAEVGGIVVANYQDKLNIGTITAMNVDEDKHLPFKVGDKVLVTKGADVVALDGNEIHIFKHDMIICSIEESKKEDK